MLALVSASKRIFENEIYFRYYKIPIYKLTSFETFLKLLQEDIIQVDIVGRVSRSGTEEGRQRNKNLVFRIEKKNITKLFETIEVYDNDSNSKFQIL